MIPPLIVQTALDKGIDIIAISDHNTTANTGAVIQAAEGTGITVIPAIELHTREEIHVLCLFPNLKQIHLFQIELEPFLSSVRNQAEIFGPQYIVDSTGEFIRNEERMLSQATSLSLEKAWELVKQFDGLFIPAHINRAMYGLLPTLGFLPENIAFDALEINPRDDLKVLLQRHPSISRFPIIFSGDAHFLDDMLGINQFWLNESSFEEICKALKNEDGRSVNMTNFIGFQF